MSKLQLTTLGRPELRVDGRVRKLPTRKALALLVYLAVEGGVHSRERLTALFWPDLEAFRGRAALRNTLTYLRSALGEERVPHASGIAASAEDQLGSEPGSRLVASRDTVSLGLRPDDDFDLDALQHAGQALRRKDTLAHDRLVSVLRATTDRCRGAFLDGFVLTDAPAFDDWVDLQRERIRRRLGAVLDRLSALHLAAGESSLALNVAARWVASDPATEAAHQRVIQVHLAAGDCAGALQAYAACRRTLKAQLDVEPAPETESLAARARAIVEVNRLPGVSKGSGSPRVAPDMSASLEAPLVGRVGQFGVLVDTLHRARRGQTEVVILEGEAGIGKTRLATEFLRWSGAQGADILFGRAFETGGRLPYQALVDALGRRLDRENAPDDLLGNVWLAELSRLLPDLRDRYPDLPIASADDSAAPARLFEAVARLGPALAQSATLVLFVDDLQWTDRASLDLLGFVARRWKERSIPAILLFTLRTEALALSRDLVDWLGDLEHDLRVTRVHLALLTSEATRQLVEGIGVRGDVDGFARWLYDETRGQPFYALESIRSLVDHGVLTPDDGTESSREYTIETSNLDGARLSGVLPPSVRHLISARLARLSPAASDLLVASAVLGKRSDFAPLCRVAGLTDDQGLRALDEAVKLQLLLVPSDTAVLATPAIYLFAHDKVRDVVYTDAGDARRRVFHRRAVDALRGAGVPAAELAHHAFAAGLAVEAFEFSLTAGEDALRVFATRDAIDHFQRALSTLTDNPAISSRPRGAGSPTEFPPAERVGQLYLQLGRAFELTSDRVNARASYETLLGYARQTGLRSIECAALNRLATLTAQNAVAVAAATALLQEARAIAEESGDRLSLAETEWNLAQIGVYTSNPAMTFEHGERALALAREYGASELVARSMNVLAYAAKNLGRWEQCEAYAGEAATTYAELGNRALEVDSLSLVANCRVKYGQLWSGIGTGRQALAISHEIENPWGQVNSAYHLVPGLLDAGLYAEALDVASRGTSTARAQLTRPMLVFSLVELGATKRALLALDEATEIHHEALALSQILPAIFREASAAALCADYAFAGRWDDAYDAARQALDARDPALLLTGFTRWAETAALVHGGESGRAESDARHFGEQVGWNRRFRIPLLRSRAVLARARGDDSLVVDDLEEAATLAREIGLPGELWSIELALAEAYRASGDHARASNALTRATTIIHALADNLDSDAVRTSFLAAATRRM